MLKIMGNKNKNKSWLTIHLEYGITVCLMTPIRLLPLRAAYKLSCLIFRLLYIFDARHRKRTISHLLHSGVAATETEAKLLAKTNYNHFGKVAVEVIKFDQIVNKENAREHFSFNGPDEIKKRFLTFGSEEPAIIVTAHCGNWEMAGNSYAYFSNITLTSIMRKLGNQKLGKLIYGRREGKKHKIVPKDKGLRPLLSALKKGESVAIVADQHASTTEGVDTVFFGHPARSHATPALLHLRTGTPIIVGIVRRLDNDFHFELRIDDCLVYEPTDDKEGDIKKLTQMYTSSLEKLIRETPEQWLWAHRRWLNINRKYSKFQKETTQNEKEHCTQP